MNTTPDELADALWGEALIAYGLTDKGVINLERLRTLATTAYELGKEEGDYHEGWEEGFKAGAKHFALAETTIRAIRHAVELEESVDWILENYEVEKEKLA